MAATETRIEVRSEIDSWLEQNWDPEITVGEWWERLGLAGWSAPGWPSEWFGHDLSRGDAVEVQHAISEFGALGAPGGLGLLLAGPTIVDHGSDEQKALYLREIVTGQKAWCQLFSEPGAGSDLAGLGCKADKDGDEWIFNGQKVWTSGGQVADLGMLIARTDPDAAKHAGITYFALPMHQEGVEVRPLVEMTGRAMFNEVFLTDARAHDNTIIGGLGNGWAVANSTLTHERAGLGAGGGSAAAGAAVPGTVIGHLERRVGDFVSSGPTKRKSGGSGGAVAGLGQAYGLLVDLAKGNGKINDPIIRQKLMRLRTINELARMGNLRAKAAKEAAITLPGFGNLSKLSMSQIVSMSRDIGLDILGAVGTLHAYKDGKGALHEATGNPFASIVTEMALFSPAPSIYGGTDQIQRNIIGERVLGLPKEPGPAKTTAYKDLPKNG